MFLSVPYPKNFDIFGQIRFTFSALRLKEIVLTWFPIWVDNSVNNMNIKGRIEKIVCHRNNKKEQLYKGKQQSTNKKQLED